MENRSKFSCSDDDSLDGNDADDGDGDGAGKANDGAEKANDGADKANDGAAANDGDDGATEDGATEDGAADEIFSDSYNTEEEGRFVNSLLENYELRRK